MIETSLQDLGGIGADGARRKPHRMELRNANGAPQIRDQFLVAYGLGREACLLGVPIEANPFWCVAEAPARKRWNDGWMHEAIRAHFAAKKGAAA